MVPTLYEGTAPSPTQAHLRRGPPLHTGAQPWQVGRLVRRQWARRRPPSKHRFSRFQPGATFAASWLLPCTMWLATPFAVRLPETTEAVVLLSLSTCLWSLPLLETRAKDTYAHPPWRAWLLPCAV